VWRADESTGAWDIAGGATLNGFTVTAEAPDESYRKAPVTIIFADGSSLQTKAWIQE